MTARIADALRARISDNYVVSEREARFALFHAGTFLTLALVTLGAILVDYMIVSEFWTRALANEFLELPGTLATSVAFKSLQVLFATIAAHILYEHMGRFGRGVFVRIVFVLALVMLLGVGVLLATMSLPNGLAATNGASGVGASLGSALAGLGIETQAAAETARASAEIDAVRTWQPLLWLGSLGIVFLVVTGVAALCIHFASEALKRVFFARDFVHRRRDMGRLAALEAEHDELCHKLSEMEGPENRRHMLWTGLMREARAYEEGLDEARRALVAPAPASRKFVGRGENMPAPTTSDRLKTCEASRDVARYERLFDEWWERRSRNAMKAGPTGFGGIREPIGELLPPIRGPRFVVPIEKAAE